MSGDLEKGDENESPERLLVLRDRQPLFIWCNMTGVTHIIDWSQIDHFVPSEFDDPSMPGTWTHMDPETIFELDRLRKATGWKIVTHNKHGIRGCVCVQPQGHSKKSRHYINGPEPCSAVDFHFDAMASSREQAMHVLRSGFTGIGIYYDWSWPDLRNPNLRLRRKENRLSVGFHVDRRRRPQIWKRVDGEYFYLLK